MTKCPLTRGVRLREVSVSGRSIVYQTRGSVSSDFQTPRSGLKKQVTAKLFKRPPKEDDTGKLCCRKFNIDHTY